MTHESSCRALHAIESVNRISGEFYSICLVSHGLFCSDALHLLCRSIIVDLVSFKKQEKHLLTLRLLFE